MLLQEIPFTNGLAPLPGAPQDKVSVPHLPVVNPGKPCLMKIIIESGLPDGIEKAPAAIKKLPGPSNLDASRSPHGDGFQVF